MTVVASNYARKENDLYQTEPWATEVLLRHLPIYDGAPIWEPSAGNHLIADVLTEHGGRVITSDIVVYDRQHHMLFDFLHRDKGASGLNRHGEDWIVTNPPYGNQNRDAVRYAELALERSTGWVALLLTAKFDFGKTRVHLFRDNDRFAFKIALIDRIQWFPGKSSGTEDHAWYVWAPSPGPGIGQARIIYEGRVAP